MEEKRERELAQREEDERTPAAEDTEAKRAAEGKPPAREGPEGSKGPEGSNVPEEGEEAPEAAGETAEEAEKPPDGGEAYPTLDELQNELQRMRYRVRFLHTLRTTVDRLIVVAALAVLVATIWLPVLRIYGSSMTPTLNEGDIVVTFKGSRFSTGDVVGLYVGNRLLVKRVIAGPGQWVNIDEDGTVYVDGKKLEEPYITDKAFGDCNIDLPYQVPETRYFVMGDHRSTSIDSRHTTVGCVADEEIVGRILFRVWPLEDFGSIKE